MNKPNIYEAALGLIALIAGLGLLWAEFSWKVPLAVLLLWTLHNLEHELRK